MSRMPLFSLAVCATLLTPPLALAAPKKPPERCVNVELLDAGVGRWRDTVSARLFRLEPIGGVSYATAQKQRARTEVFAAPECKELAAQVATAVGVSPQAVQPLTWKAQGGIVVAAAALEHAAGDEALFVALNAGDVAGVKAALARGVDVDVLAPEGKHEAALTLATQKGSLELVRLLLDKGFQAAGLSHGGERPLVVAARAGQLPLLQLLLERGAPAEDAALCAALAHPEAVKLLLARGAKANANCGDRSTELALSKAAEAGHVATVKLLLEAKADPNLILGNPKETGSWTPFFHARNVESARLLLAAGAKVNVRDNQGYTPLHLFVREAPVELIALLLEHGANVHAVDDDGWTPLHRAALEAKDPAVLELLVQKGAPLDARSKQSVSATMWKGEEEPEWTVAAGSTALDVAVVAGREEAAAVLAKLGARQRTTKGKPLPGASEE